jgi:hypothetical protein
VGRRDSDQLVVHGQRQDPRLPSGRRSGVAVEVGGGSHYRRLSHRTSDDRGDRRTQPVQDPPPRPTRRQPSPTTGGVATSPGNVRRRPATPRARAAAKPAIVTGRPPARGALVCRHRQLLLRARCRSLKRGPSSLEPPHNLDRGTLQDRLRQCGPQGFVQPSHFAERCPAVSFPNGSSTRPQTSDTSRLLTRCKAHLRWGSGFAE